MQSFLKELGFEKKIIEKVIQYIDILDKKEKLEEAPIEVKIVSSADGAAHLVGPFFNLYWYEYNEKDIGDLMAENKRKLLVDWQKKIVLPEVKAAFINRHNLAMEQAGEFPDKFLS